jgi:glutamyl-Q tRNA(Asp) synthetase
MQKITRIVRGCDLLETTAKQILMMQTLGSESPEYAHIPVIVDEHGLKLSKQNHAKALSENTENNLKRACLALGMCPPSDLSSAESILNWAIGAWDIKQLKNQKQISEAKVSLG